MRQEVLVHWRDAVDFHLHADTAPPMEPDEARTWLDAQFTALECEPLRALGKVLTADKVLALARGVGIETFEKDPAFRDAFAAAVVAALGNSLVRIDADTGSVTF